MLLIIADAAIEHDGVPEHMSEAVCPGNVSPAAPYHHRNLAFVVEMIRNLWPDDGRTVAHQGIGHLGKEAWILRAGFLRLLEMSAIIEAQTDQFGRRSDRWQKAHLIERDDFIRIFCEPVQIGARSS